MSNSEEKHRTLTILEQAWAKHPHMRLGQLLSNALGEDDLFYIPNDKLVRKLNKQ